MDIHQFHEREEKCSQDDIPRCSAACPVHVDVKGVLQAAKTGDFTKAYALLGQALPFPGIIGRVCDQPCRSACRRGEVDEGLAINDLEQACATYNAKPLVRKCLAAGKDKNVAVVGGGLSGLTAAFYLAGKGYRVTVLDARDRLGGRLLDIPEDRLPRRVLEDDLAALESLKVAVRLGARVGDDAGGVPFSTVLEEFDAVYLGLGHGTAAGLDLGLELNADGGIRIDPGTLATSNPKVFAGGSHRRGGGCPPPMDSIADGKAALVSIDRYLQDMAPSPSRSKFGPRTTRLFTSVDGVPPRPAVPMADPGLGYSREEAMAEADRCLACQCMECYKRCEYMQHFKMPPLALARQIFRSNTVLARRANKLMNSCSLCRQCEAVCQDGFCLADICLAAREDAVKAGKMPPSAFGFALQDLKYSNSDACTLSRHEPGRSESEYVFYPGCQLSGSAPWQVAKAYAFLREKLPGGVGLLLGCCGVQALWAGELEMFMETLTALRAQWEGLGKGVMIVGCPTCFMVFKQYLPEMAVEFLPTFMDKLGLPEPLPAEARVVAVHDSCTTRYQSDIQDGVRDIARKLGYAVEELPTRREKTECCGFGGLMQISNKDLAHRVMDRRIGESESDYLVYCAMCRDNFSNRGKATYHLLDLIFGDEEGVAAARPPVGYSRRHENRARLKNRLLREVWGEDSAYDPVPVRLRIAPEVRRVMEDGLIVDADIYRVVEYAERTGNKLRNSVTGHFVASYKPEHVTYWAEYTVDEDGYTIHDAYSHRMEMIEPAEAEAEAGTASRD